MFIWTLIGKTEKFFYWQHWQGFYNCSEGETLPPTTAGGYWSLQALMKLKGDNGKLN